MSGVHASGKLASTADRRGQATNGYVLYRLGGWAFQHRRTVLVGWLVVLGVVIASAAVFSGQTSNEFAVPGTESQRAQDLLHEKFAGAGGASARVVFAAPRGERLTDPENRAAVMASVARAKKAADVSFVSIPSASAR